MMSFARGIICLFGILITPALAFLSTDAQDAPPHKPLRVMLELSDGSQIIGTPQIASLPVTLNFGAEVDIPLDKIQSLDVGKDGQPSRISLIGGDVLTGDLVIEAFMLEALFGIVKADITNIVRLRVIGERHLPTSLQEGLLLHYTFDRDGGQIADASGHDRHGKPFNVKWTPQGRVGGAMQFSGQDSHIVTHDRELPMGDAPRSIAFWLKLGQDQSHSHILSYGNPNQHNQMVMLSIDWRVNRNSIAFSQYGGVHVASTRMVPDRWYHVVYTYGGGGQHAFYVDGKFSPPQAQELRTINTQPSGKLLIGSNSLGHFLDGWLDEVMIYDRVLTPEEIQQLYTLKRI